MYIEMKRKTMELGDDLRFLAYPLKPADKEKLAYSVICNDFRQTIPTWHYQILDHFDYYDICRENGIPFETKRRRFRTKNDAIIWMCRNNLANPNITKTYKNYIIGILFEAEYKNILRSDVAPGEVRKTKVDLSEDIGREFNIGLRMSLHYVRYAKSMKKLLKKHEKLGMMVLSEMALVSHPALDALTQLDINALTKVVDTIEDYDVTCRVQYKPGPSHNNKLNISIRPESKSRQCVTLPVHSVKDLPAPDPDAEISSLSLTIPTWVNSIRRKCNATNFDEASPQAKEKLMTELQLLQSEVAITFNYLREDDDYE